MENNFEHLYLENQLCFPMYAASRLTTQIYTPHLQALDLTYPQYLVLLVLWQYENQTVNDIGSKLKLESNTLTPLLKRMEQKGLISRTRSKSDERVVVVSLTENGLRLKTKASSIPEKLIASVHQTPISLDEMEQFKSTLNKLINVLAKL